MVTSLLAAGFRVLDLGGPFRWPRQGKTCGHKHIVKLLAERRGIAIARCNAKCVRKKRRGGIIAHRQCFRVPSQRSCNRYHLPASGLAGRKTKFVPLQVHVCPRKRGDVLESLTGVKCCQDHPAPLLRRDIQQNFQLVRREWTTIPLDGFERLHFRHRVFRDEPVAPCRLEKVANDLQLIVSGARRGLRRRLGAPSGDEHGRNGVNRLCGLVSEPGAKFVRCMFVKLCRPPRRFAPLSSEPLFGVGGYRWRFAGGGRG